MTANCTKASIRQLREFDVTKFLELFHQPVPQTSVVASELKKLYRLVEALPLTTAEFCFAHNWLTSAQKCWAMGERSTAYYQIRMVIKKLGLGEEGVKEAWEPMVRAA